MGESLCFKVFARKFSLSLVHITSIIINLISLGSVGMKYDELKSKLNPSFELEKALQDAIGNKHSLMSVS